MNKGDIVLVPFPFTDLSWKKTRPALILAVMNLDIIVAFISSQERFNGEFDIPVIPETMNGLKRPSVIKISKLATIDKQLLLGRLGSVGSISLNEINKGLLSLFTLL